MPNFADIGQAFLDAGNAEGALLDSINPPMKPEIEFDPAGRYFASLYWADTAKRPTWSKIKETAEFNGYDVVSIGILGTSDHTAPTAHGYGFKFEVEDSGKKVKDFTLTMTLGHGADGVGVWPSASTIDQLTGNEGPETIEGAVKPPEEENHFFRNLAIGVVAILAAMAVLAFAVRK